MCIRDRLEAELKRSVSGVTELVLDFTGLEYISSAGLRVLLAAQKVMNKQGKIDVYKRQGRDWVDEAVEIAAEIAVGPHVQRAEAAQIGYVALAQLRGGVHLQKGALQLVREVRGLSLIHI